MSLCKLGTVKRQAGGSNMPTVHGGWVAEPGSTMERCYDWHPCPGVPTEQWGTAHFCFVNDTCGYTFKEAPGAAPARQAGADEENQ